MSSSLSADIVAAREDLGGGRESLGGIVVRAKSCESGSVGWGGCDGGGCGWARGLGSLELESGAFGGVS